MWREEKRRMEIVNKNFQQSSAPEPLMMKTDKGYFFTYIIEGRGNGNKESTVKNNKKQTNNEKLLYICQKVKSNFPASP